LRSLLRSARASYLMPTMGVLKLARDAKLIVHRSELVFFDSANRAIVRFGDAFGLSAGTRFQGPYSQKLYDQRARPEDAVTMRWDLDDAISTPVRLIDSEADQGWLRVEYFPRELSRSSRRTVLAMCSPRDSFVV
jgi:hypothetical protein